MKMKKLVIFAFALFAVFAFSSTASAAIFTFEFFGGPGSNFSSLEFFDTTNTIKTTVTGFNTNGQAQVSWSGSGLGVKGPSGDTPQLDGNNQDEQLFFSFDSPFTIVSVRFNSFGSNDEFSFQPDDGPFFDNLNPNAPNSTYVFNSTWTEDLFKIGAVDSNDEFYVKKLKVKGDLPVPPTKPVPEPATMALFGTGLAGLGLRNRKKNLS